MNGEDRLSAWTGYDDMALRAWQQYLSESEPYRSSLDSALDEAWVRYLAAMAYAEADRARSADSRAGRHGRPRAGWHARAARLVVTVALWAAVPLAEVVMAEVVSSVFPAIPAAAVWAAVVIYVTGCGALAGRSAWRQGRSVWLWAALGGSTGLPAVVAVAWLSRGRIAALRLWLGSLATRSPPPVRAGGAGFVVS